MAANTSGEVTTDTPKEGAAEIMGDILKHKLREPDLKYYLNKLFECLGYDTILEYSTGDGSADIYLSGRRFVVETKGFGIADPEKRGSGDDETQFQQCERYVRADHRRESQQLRFGDDNTSALPWRAVLTDGHKWWLWEWETLPGGTLGNPDPKKPKDKRVFTHEQSEQAVDWLVSHTSDMAGKRWVPSDPTYLFEPFKDKLCDIYEDLKDDQGAKTQKELWLDMLRGSGSAPQKAEQEKDLFVLHTLLVTVAKAVIATLADSEPDPLEVMSEGFASWPQARTRFGPTNNEGVDWIKQVFARVDEYDWRQRGQDVLQALYQNLIVKEHRKAYGEYYTPDWLAEAVTETVLDDDWLKRSVPAILKNPNAEGVGVLDPACGSGTFLFHAARRILTSPAVESQCLTPVQKADLVADLISGIDIHPVAAEISRATLLRALPAIPSAGANALRVFQGDSLLWNSMIEVGNQQAPNVQGSFNIKNDQFVISSPKNRQIHIPLTFPVQPTFNSDITRIVHAAHNNEPEMPHIFSKLEDDDKDTLKETFEALKKVIAAEGNSVWAWYITNAAAPLGIRQRKVDRIVANPPWVRMSNINVKTRKRELESIAELLKLWRQGKSNTGFDIAGLFMVRCRDNYLTPTPKTTNDDTLQSLPEPAAGWVIPWGSIKADNWATIREAQHRFTNIIWDLADVREQPFTGSKTCVWIQTTKKNPSNPPTVRRLVNKPRNVKRNDTWHTAKALTEFVDVPQPPDPKRSEYFTTKPARPVFAQGATLVPNILVKVDNNKKSSLPDADGNFSVTTTASRHNPWKKAGVQEGEVPSRWLHQSVFSNDLLVYVLRDPLPEAILPLTEKYELDPAREDNPYWNKARRIYDSNKGKGKSTPKTLWKQINFQNKLMKQLNTNHLRSNKKLKVLYNKSGQYLRAARCLPSVVAVDVTYQATFDTTEEACYLTAILNAECLQNAYARARKSDRDFHQHFWYKVPIPKYDPTNTDHQTLAQLCLEAEKAALTKMNETNFSNGGGQIKCSNIIRKCLTDNAISESIDETVRRILPGYATPD